MQTTLTLTAADRCGGCVVAGWVGTDSAVADGGAVADGTQPSGLTRRTAVVAGCLPLDVAVTGDGTSGYCRRRTLPP